MDRSPALLAAVQVVCVGAVLGVVAVVSIALDEAVLVPSLAACAFLQLLLPDTAAARPWAVIVGQSCGLASGTAAVHLLGTAHLPVFAPPHPLDPRRAAAAVLAACLTLAAQRALRAGNAAGAALAVTIAIGAGTADLAGAGRAAAGIAIVAALGEPARRLILVVRRG